MNKVLIITYYWPPSGGSGVQRWLKFVKYLQNFGWEPIIYTPENPERPVKDDSLEKDIPENIRIIRTKIKEPYSLYKLFIGKGKKRSIQTGFLSENKTSGFKEKISNYIRSNFFIPDARKLWIKPSVKFLNKYLKANPVDLIVTTGPPHSMHLIGSGLKKSIGLKWLADFRDPWTNIDYYQKLLLTKKADKRHKKLESEVLKNADEVVVISPGMKDDFNKLYKRNYKIITNGYDSDDFNLDEAPTPDQEFSLVHIGALNEDRNPEILWQVLSQLINETEDFGKHLKVRLIGSVDYSVKKSVEKYHLNQYVEIIDHISHNEVLNRQKSSQVLLLLINNTPNAKLVMTGKLFEYIASGRPILCIGPEDGDAAHVINDTKTGFISGFSDEKNLKTNIKNLFSEYQKGSLFINGKETEKYSRYSLTKELSLIFDQIKHS